MTEKKKKKGSALTRIARAIDAAGRDADVARRSANDPEFRRGVREDLLVPDRQASTRRPRANPEI